MEKSICFVTLGDMKVNASSKRALNMSMPLANRGWDVTIIIKDTEENRHQISMNCSEKIQIFYFPESSIIEENRYKKRIIKQIKPDVVYLSALNYRNFFKMPKSSIVIVEHCELYSRYKNLKIYSRMMALFFELFSIFYADAFIVASRYLEHLYKKRTGLFFKQLPLLYLPYAYSDSKNKYNYTIALPKKECVTFVYLGSIREEYGIFTVLNAVKILIKDSSKFKVYMLGVGKDLGNAMKYVSDNGLEDFVEFCGYVQEENVSAYMRIADAFLSPMNDTPQDWARCPSKLYMYLPYKKPVITCKIGEPYEVLKEEGLYYIPSNSQSMASCMKKVLSGKKKTINIESEAYTWEALASVFDKWVYSLF